MYYLKIARNKKINPAFYIQDAGFTLIELLVIVSILALIVAVFLTNMERNKNNAKDAAVKSSLLEVQKSAELLYSNTKSYKDVCDSTNTTLSDEGDFGRIKSYIEKNNGVNGVIGCKSTQDEYAVISSLNLGDCWCVDWQGKSKKVVLNGASDCRARLTTTSCP